MRENQKLIDDVMALGGNLLGNFLGARHEVRAQAGQRVESLVQRFNLVSRSEFDAAFAMLAKARAMQDELLERLEAIEAKLERSLGKRSEPRERSIPAKAGIQKHVSSTTKRAKASKRRLPSVKNSNRRKKRA
jgi:BMFP domain-containing protein YqiC